MKTFKIRKINNSMYRCILGDLYYFNIPIVQRELFETENYLKMLESAQNSVIYDISDNLELGDFVSARYVKERNEIWVLIRNGVFGELYAKSLGK
jgi:hypothetical protein